MNLTPTIRYAINTHGCDKVWDFEALTAKFQDKTGTLQDVVDHVKQGHAVCAGQLGGQRRSKANVIGSQWVLLDVDNTALDADGNKIYDPQLTLEQALVHPFIQKYCSLIYTSASHRPDWHKFRLVFLLPQFETSTGILEAMIRQLMAQLPHDPACKDASRVFYGNTNAEIPLFNPDVTLPDEWRAIATATAAEEATRAWQQRHDREVRQAEYQRSLASGELSQQDTDALVESALQAITPRDPGSGNYQECLTVLMALYDHYGESEAERIAQLWSPSIKGTSWDVGRKLRSFKRGGVTIGSLFHIAKQHGWKFPQRDRHYYDNADLSISPEAWEKKHGKLPFEPKELTEEEEKASRERYLKKVCEAQIKLNTLSYKPDILLHEEYLPSDLGTKLPDTGIVLLKARKGGGKSTIIKERIAHYKAQGRKILSITPRIALGREQGFKWDITWIDECGVKGNHTLNVGLLNQEDALGLCWDSLWRVTGQNWEGAVIIIDEAELGLKHLATSSTCADRRAFIMVGFADLLGKVLASDGLVILSDADLTDVSVDYVRAFVPQDTPVFTTVNTHQGTPWQVDLFLEKRGTCETTILDNLACGLKTAVPTDSQREAEALERSLIEHYPSAKIIRIDRKTCQEALGRNFVIDPNNSILALQPDILIYTPSMGTGVSIDVGWFDAVVGMFSAVIEPTEACQMMARVRDSSIPRSVWVKDASWNSSGCKSPLPEVVKKQMLKFNESSTTLIGLANALSTDSGDDSGDDSDALAKLNRLWDKEKQEWNTPHTDLYANVTARRNFGLSQFATQFHQQLIDDGHNVNIFEGEKTSFSEEITEAKEEIKQEEAQAIASADIIDIESAWRILSSPNSTEEARHKARRAILVDSLPGIEPTQDFVYKAVVDDHGRWLAHHRLFWLAMNPDKTKILDTKQWRWHLGKAQVYLPDIHTHSLQVRVLSKIGILDLIESLAADPAREIHADDPDVENFLKLARSMRRWVKTAFDLTVTGKTDQLNF